MFQRYDEFHMRTRNIFHVGIRVSTNCAITGAIFPLSAERQGIIERRAMPRKRVAVVRWLCFNAHIFRVYR